MKTAFPLFMLLASALSQADEPASVASKKLADCTVPAVTAARMYESLQRSADLASATLPLLEKMRALSNKAHDPNRPVGEQLSRDDLEKFGEVRSRLMALQWKRLIESRYSKHMELIEKMTEAVDVSYRWGREPDENSPDFTVASMPSVLQQISPVQTFNPPKEDHCTLQWALHLQEQPSLTALNTPDLGAAAKQINFLREKYHVQKLDRNMLSPDDQRILDEAQVTLTRLGREGSHAQEIEQIKTMAQAADIIYAANMQDLEQSAGDPDSSINTLQTMKKDGRLTDQIAIRVAIWSKLDEKYPSEEAQALDQAAKAMRAVPSK